MTSNSVTAKRLVTALVTALVTDANPVAARLRSVCDTCDSKKSFSVRARTHGILFSSVTSVTSVTNYISN